MANPAAEAHARVLATHPEAVVVERGRNHLKHRLADVPDGRQRFALDCSIGPLHYQDGDWHEIDTAFLPSIAPWNWEMTKAGFEVRALSRLDAGQVIEYRSGSEYVRFQPMALQYSNDLDQIQQISMPTNVEAAVHDDTLTWTDGYGPSIDISWQAQTARLAKRLTIHDPAALPSPGQYILDGGEPVLELNFIFAFSSGVTPWINGQPWDKKQRETQGLVEFRDGGGNVLWWFNLPRSWDSSGEPESGQQLGTFRFKRQGNSLFVSHRVPLGFIQGATYPLTIDVNVDETVAADADDAYEKQDGTGFDATANYVYMSAGASPPTPYIGGLRFASVAVPNAATIDVAYFSIVPYSNAFDDPRLYLHLEDEDNPVNFVDDADVWSRTRTTESASWIDSGIWVDATTYVDSSSIVNPVQEVVDRGGWATGQAMVVIGRGYSDANSDFLPKSHENTDNVPAKLHIEYSAGAAAIASLRLLRGAGR